MYEFIESVEFARLKNFYIGKYSYCIDYDDIVSLVNYAVIESISNEKYDSTRSSYKTFIYQYVNWTILKYIAKEVKHSHTLINDTLMVDNAERFSYHEEIKQELNEVLDSLKPPLGDILVDRFINGSSLHEISKKYKLGLEKTKTMLNLALDEAQNLVYNKL